MWLIKWLLEKKDALFPSKEKVQPAEKQPLVFVNQPIDDSEHDIVGFSSRNC